MRHGLPAGPSPTAARTSQGPHLGEGRSGPQCRGSPVPVPEVGSSWGAPPKEGTWVLIPPTARRWDPAAALRPDREGASMGLESRAHGSHVPAPRACPAAPLGPFRETRLRALPWSPRRAGPSPLCIRAGWPWTQPPRIWGLILHAAAPLAPPVPGPPPPPLPSTRGGCLGLA